MNKYDRNMAAEIELGAPTCKHIKNIFYPNRPWVEVYRDVASKFTELKQIMYKIYPELKRIDIVRELSTYSQQDIKDLFG